MKIINSTPNYINQTYANPANNAANQDLKSQRPFDDTANATKSDSINFSDRTKDLQKISKAMETEPAGRDKYVADIKQKVDTGQYNINAETVAEKIIGVYMNQLG